MLYIFLVDTGSMVTLEMDLALASVEELKAAIAHKLDIPVDKQVSNYKKFTI